MLEAFLAALPAGARTAFGQAPDLEARLARLVEDAHSAWPSLRIPADSFLAHVAERLSGDAAVPAALSQMHASDLYLAAGCCLGLPGAIAAFETTTLGQVDAALLRMRADRTLVDEARQIVRERLFVGGAGGRPKMAEYAGRGPLASWVRVVATRVALNLIRDRKAEIPAEEDVLEAAAPVAEGPELTYLRKQHGPQIRAAFRQAMATLAPRERLVLRQHFLDGLGTDQIGELHQVHRVTVLRWLTRARATLARRTRRSLEQQLGCTESTVDSLMQLVQGQIDVSIHRSLMADAAAAASATGGGAAPGPRPR